MNYSETKLVSEIKNKNKNAYEFLIDSYSKPVYYLAYTILNINCTKEDIEECVSDVFFDVWQKISSFDEERGSFRTWILILTKYKALSYKRKNENQNILNIEDYEIEGQINIEKK